MMASGGEDPLVDADETDKGMLDEKIAVNFASKEQLMSVSGIGEKIASAILSVRESSGNITKPVLNLLTKNTLPAESWSQLDFHLNTSLDPGMMIDESVKFKHPSTLSGIETTPHPSGPTSSVKDAIFSGARLDTIKKHLTPTKHVPVKSELVSPPPHVNIPNADWETVLEVVKLAQTFVPQGSGSPITPRSGAALRDDDLESLPSIPNRSPGTLLPDGRGASSKSRAHLEATKLHFSESEVASASGSSNSDDSYMSAVSKVSNNKHSKRKPQHMSDKKKRSHDIIRNFPKGLYFDGKGNWEAFKQKFKQCATALEWTTNDCLMALQWSLTGKAADFYSVVGDQKGITYLVLMKKIENRFGARELPATAQARFQQATQSPTESLEDWADRVLTLASRAFRDLPEHYSTLQAITRFSQGLAVSQPGKQ